LVEVIRRRLPVVGLRNFVIVCAWFALELRARIAGLPTPEQAHQKVLVI
jgi:hypothetical protein